MRSILRIYHRRRVCTILTDGDSQETAELDAAILMGVYGNAVRRRCGWHILHQGIKNILYQKYITGEDKNDETKEVVENITVWIQNLLMKTVENEEEYNM
jgi:hypothetical protein